MILLPRNIRDGKKDRKKDAFYELTKSKSSYFNEYLHRQVDYIVLGGNSSNRKKKKKNESGRELKKKTVENVPLIIPVILYGEKVEVEINKKAGKYPMAGGCTLTIEEGVFAKKAIIASCVVPPNKRSDFKITCEYQSFLISELFVLCSKHVPKKPMSVYIPTVLKTNRYCQLISCNQIEFNWLPVTDYKLEPDGVQFSMDTWGIYAVIQKCPFEKINVTKQGGIINTQIHPLVSIRIPKLASPIDYECTLQFLEANKNAVEDVAPCYPNELQNIVNMSSMLCFKFPQIQFKRPVTIKIPLPKWVLEPNGDEIDNKKISDLMLLCKRQGSWDTIETTVNYTKNTFSFDTKVFGTFVLLEPRANREGKVKTSLPRFEYANNITRGAFLVFLWMEPKSWFLWIELVSINKISETRNIREEAGLLFLEQYMPSNQSLHDNSLSRRRMSRKSLVPTNSDCKKTVELCEGSVFHLTMRGDIKFKDSSVNAPLISKPFQKMFHSAIKKTERISHVKEISRADSNHSSTDSDGDRLSRVGIKKEPISKEAESEAQLSLVFYSKMKENYRVVEIEPINNGNLTTDVLEKWKEVYVSSEDRDLDNEKESDKYVGDIGALSKVSRSTDSSIVQSVCDRATLGKFEILGLRAENAKSLERIQSPHEDLQEHIFNATLKITHEKKNLQIPPNHFEDDLDDDKKKVLLEYYLPKEVLQYEYQYKFHLLPEELREYLGLAKPSMDAIAVLREKKRQQLLNPYLKDVTHCEKDRTVLECAKNSAITNIASKTPDIIFNKTTEFKKTINRDQKSKNTKVGRASEKVNVDGVYKEPKVLNGKSLLILSRYIEHGLTLAVHLNIPDATITGIGFDSLSANLTLADVSYKVLTQWKRTVPVADRDKMVSTLLQALRSMNLSSISDIIKLSYEKNEELKKETFRFLPVLPHNEEDDLNYVEEGVDIGVTEVPNETNSPNDLNDNDSD